MTHLHALEVYTILSWKYYNMIFWLDMSWLYPEKKQ